MCLGMPGRIVEIGDVVKQRALVDVDGVRSEVSVAMIDGVDVGDWVVVHLGFAMARIDEEEALHLLGSLRELTLLYERELSDEAPSPEKDVVEHAADRPAGR